MNEHPRRDVDDRLADWVDGRMSDKDRERFVGELRVNAQLRQDLERYERTVGVLRAALRAPGPSAGIADRVMAAIAAPASPPVRRFPMRRMGWGLAAAAAVLAAAVWIDAWMPASPSGQDTAAVDRARDAGVASKAPADDEQAPPAKPDAVEAEKKRADTDKLRVAGEVAGTSGNILVGPETKTVAPDAPASAPSPARELADGRVPESPSTRAATPEEDRGRLAAGTGAPTAPSTPTPSGPATGGPGARSQPMPVVPDASRVQEEVRKEAGEGRAIGRDAERADAPVSLMVVEGLAVPRATGDAKSELTKDQAERRGAPTAGGGEGSKAKGGESTGRDDFYVRHDGAALDARIDEFLAGAASPDRYAAAIAWWTPRGELRLSPTVDVNPEPAPQPGAGTAGAQAPIVRTWLVEGTRADVEVLLARLARFTKQHKLTQRLEETKPPVEQRAASKNANEIADQTGTESTLQPPAAGQQRSEVSRIVLRFRLRPR